MKTFPASFEAEKNLKSGVSPTWILKLTIGGNTLYLSDNAYQITPWSVSTKAWVSDWGSITEGITGSINEMKTADLVVRCINDQAEAQNLEYYLKNNIPEKDPAELYLWFHGLADPPQIMFRGYVRNYVFEDDTMITLTIQDEAERLQKYIGTKVTVDDYPDANPSDVGRVIPIVYGAVKKLRCLEVEAGGVTTLRSGITSTDTNIEVSEPDNLPSSGTVQIDDEQIHYTGKSGNQLTGVTRGYSSTVATSHQMGASVWEVRGSYKYLAAESGSISKVYGKLREGIFLDVTSLATITTLNGNLCVQMPAYITVRQAVDLMVQDGIDVDDALAIVDSIAVNDTIDVSDTIIVDDTIAVDDTIDVTEDIAFSTDVESEEMRLCTGTPVQQTDASHGSKSVYFPSMPRNCSNYDQIWREYNFTGNVATPPTGGGYLVFKVEGVEIGRIDSNGWHQSAASPMIITDTTCKTGSQTIFTYTKYGTISDWGSWTVTLDSASQHGTIVPALSKSGTASKTGTASKVGAATKSGTASKTGAASKSGTVDRSGQVSKTGTVSLIGNQSAGTLLANEIYVDITGASGSPTAVFQDILSRAGWTGGFTGSDNGFSFNGAITEYRRAIDWLQYLAFQCRSYFKVSNGTARLIYRPDTPASDKTIPACRLRRDGRRVIRRRQTPLEDIINNIQVLYDRDWSLSGRGDDSYKGISKASDATSIANYGERERPELFMFDFITSAALAASLRDFYLSKYKDRHWIYDFEVFLDHAELEFSDCITLSFLDNALCEVQEMNFQPGDMDNIDTIRIVCRRV